MEAGKEERMETSVLVPMTTIKGKIKCSITMYKFVLNLKIYI